MDFLEEINDELLEMTVNLIGSGTSDEEIIRIINSIAGDNKFLTQESLDNIKKSL